MSKLLVLGTTPQAAVLAQVLRVCTERVAQAPQAEPEWLVHTGQVAPRQRTAWRREAKQYGVIVALPSRLRQASEALSLVHRLRTDLLWTRRFIAVMRSDAQAARLKSASFVGEAIEGTRFGEVSAHEVTSAPLQLSDLLVILEREAPRISPDYWHNKLLRSGRAAQLDRQITEGERCLERGRAEANRSIRRDILASLHEIDWGLVARGADGHALKNDVRDLLDRHAAKERLTGSDLSAILKEAKSVLSRSSFPFPEKN